MKEKKEQPSYSVFPCFHSGQKSARVAWGNGNAESTMQGGVWGTGCAVKGRTQGRGTQYWEEHGGRNAWSEGSVGKGCRRNVEHGVGGSQRSQCRGKCGGKGVKHRGKHREKGTQCGASMEEGVAGDHR